MTGVEVGILIVGGVLVAAEIVEEIRRVARRRRVERNGRRLDELNTPEQQYGVVRRAA